MSQLHAVVGAGEVGRAIAAVLQDAWHVELSDLAGPQAPADVLHVCYPYGTFDFEGATLGHWRMASSPRLVVVHSTVPVGTSSRLQRVLGVPVVHSPVTGRHPYLERSVRTFTKFFGGTVAVQAAAIFTACGVRTATTPAPETTEAGKLWQTLQFGLLVATQKEAYAFMAEVGADPDVAYRRMNEAYSLGYAALGDRWALPVIDDVPGPIGGHCIVPNAHLTPARLAQLLLQIDAEQPAAAGVALDIAGGADGTPVGS